jgi:hypothetical protein
MQIDLVRTNPRPVLLIKCPKPRRKAAANEVFDRLLKMGLFANFSRGVDIDPLSYILANGCDVSPTNSPMFVADGMDKALSMAERIKLYKSLISTQSRERGPKSALRKGVRKLKTEEKVHFVGTVDGWQSHLVFHVSFRRRAPDDPVRSSLRGGIEALMALAIFVETDAGSEATLSLLKSCKDPIWS